MKIKILFVVLTAITIACNDTGTNDTIDKKAKADSLQNEVIAGHDIGMAKMPKLKRTRDAVDHKLDSLRSVPAAKIDSAYTQGLQEVRNLLIDAEGHMNNWMENFKLDSASDNLDIRIKYLEGEKATVTVVKDKILNSLQRADSILAK
jgi:hypothetical protein